MQIKPFNLGQQIRLYNARTSSAIAVDETFQLYSLSKEGIHFFNTCTASITQSYQKFNGVKHIHHKVRFKREIARNLKANYFDAVKKDLCVLKEESHLLQSQRWYLAQQKTLAKKESWTIFIHQAHDAVRRGNLTRLWSEWQRHQDYTHYSSEAIWYVADELLPLLEQYHDFSMLEMIQKRYCQTMPLEIIESYHQYLNALGAEIKQQRAAIGWAMLARLSVANQRQDLWYDDVTLHLAEALLLMGVTKCDNGYLREPRRGLTPALFTRFHQYILQFGTDAQHKVLSTFSWFQPNHAFKVLHLERLCIIPTSIYQQHTIPRYYFSRMLFPRRWFRGHFFQQHFSLMARLRMLSPLKVDEVGLDQQSIRSIFSELDDLQQALYAADDDAKTWYASHLFAWFHQSTNAFIDSWCDVSLQYQQHTVVRKMTVIHGLVTRIEASLKTDATPAVEHVACARLLLRKCHEIERQINGLQLESNCLAAFSKDRSVLHRFLDINESQMSSNVSASALESQVTEQNRAEANVDGTVAKSQVSNHKVLSESKATFFQMDRPSIPLSYSAGNEEERAIDQLDRQELSVDKPLDINLKEVTILSMLSSLELFSMQPVLFDTVLHSIEQEIQAQRYQADEFERFSLDQDLIQIFQFYLHHCSALENEVVYHRIADRLSALESLLLKYGPDHMQQRLQALIMLRQQPDWVFAFTLKATAYSCVYQQKNVKEDSNDGFKTITA